MRVEKSRMSERLAQTWAQSPEPNTKQSILISLTSHYLQVLVLYT